MTQVKSPSSAYWMTLFVILSVVVIYDMFTVTHSAIAGADLKQGYTEHHENVRVEAKAATEAKFQAEEEDKVKAVEEANAAEKRRQLQTLRTQRRGRMPS